MANVPKISTMVTFRQHRFALVDAFVTTHRSDIAEALELMLPGGEDEPLPHGPPWTLWTDTLMRRLRDALDQLIEAEHRHLDVLGSQALPRQRRDQAIAEVRQLLFDLRQIYRGLYGQHEAADLGFEKRIAKDPLPLLRQGHRVDDQLLESAAASAPPKPRYAGLEINSLEASNHLGPRLRELREAMDQVHDHLVRANRTKVTKERAMRAFDENYHSIVKMMISAFHLSGQSELAAKLPLSLRRRKPPLSSQSRRKTD